MEVPESYRGLRLIGLLATIVAWIVLVVGLVFVIWLFFATGDTGPGLLMGGRNWIALIILLWVVLNFLQLYVTGGTLSLLTSMERNVRAQAEATERLAKLMGESPKAPGAPPFSVSVMREGEGSPASGSTQVR